MKTVATVAERKIPMSEEMVGLLDFIFVRWSFLSERHSRNIKKSDTIKFLATLKKYQKNRTLKFFDYFLILPCF